MFQRQVNTKKLVSHVTDSLMPRKKGEAYFDLLEVRYMEDMNPFKKHNVETVEDIQKNPELKIRLLGYG